MYLETKGAYTILRKQLTTYYFPQKNSIINLWYGSKVASKNTEIFETKLRASKSWWLLQCITFLVYLTTLNIRKEHYE